MKEITFEPRTLDGITLMVISVDGKDVGVIGTTQDYINTRIITPTDNTATELMANLDKYTAIFLDDVWGAKKKIINGSEHVSLHKQPRFEKLSEAIHYVTKRLEGIE